MANVITVKGQEVVSKMLTTPCVACKCKTNIPRVVKQKWTVKRTNFCLPNGRYFMTKIVTDYYWTIGVGCKCAVFIAFPSERFNIKKAAVQWLSERSISVDFKVS